MKNRGLDKSKATKVKKARASFMARADGACRPSVEQLESRELLSSTWFVSPGGSNHNPGTLAAPFQTIQQAANMAHAGDHVEILAGVYHETVTPPNSGTPGNPITFEAYNGANVTIDGADPISGWTQYKGSIYSAPMSWDLGEGNNEVFVNGAAINEAVWPNSAVGNFSHPVNATIQSSRISGNTAVIYNSALNQPANTWKGAVIHMDPGQNWENQTGTVIASAPGSITISFVNHGQYALPTAGVPFYLFGKFQALDSAGEWYRDPTTGRLYAWMPNGASPATQNVEAKHRLYGFNLNNVHDVTIHALKFFATSISTSSHSTHVILNGITAQYVTQSLQIPQGWWQPPTNDGIDIMGANSIVENSTIAFSSGDGIVAGAAGVMIENNVVHDVGYTGAILGGIRAMSSYVTISHNTIYNAGHHGILAEVAHATITYNTIHDVGLVVTEAGGIYTANTNGQGSVIAYNTIYNMHEGGFGGTALFTDNNSSNWIVHNNITYNVDYSLKMNYTSNNNVIYNNTMGATKMAINTNQQGNWNGVKIYNNIFEAAVLFTRGGSEYNNASSAGAANSSQGAGNVASGAAGVSFNLAPAA